MCRSINGPLFSQEIPKHGSLFSTKISVTKKYREFAKFTSPKKFVCLFVCMVPNDGGTPLNNPPIEIHTNSSMFALIFWPHMTIFCIFLLHECLKWILEFISKSLVWCQLKSRQNFEVRAIEQRHHGFQLIHMPPHQFWPRYHSDGLSPVHVRFEFLSKQICNVEALICHFYKNIKTLTQIHFPRDAHIFRTCTIFYRHYKGLHQMRKDLVLCALTLMGRGNVVGRIWVYPRVYTSEVSMVWICSTRKISFPNLMLPFASLNCRKGFL